MHELIPANIKIIMQEILAGGHAAYLVGGAVRDLLLGRIPADFDLATDAAPEDIIALATRAGWKTVDSLGRNFGVAVVVVNGEAVEVATYRGEHYGADSHRPEKVWFSTTLAEDLSRRDFTINAMALSIDGILQDPFDGRKDLSAGLLRAVGRPRQRFAEDALRMFRACRFAAELGFDIDGAVLEAMPANLSRVSGLSMERVREEIQRTLLAKQPERGLDALVISGLAGAQCRVTRAAVSECLPILPELSHMVGLNQNSRFHLHDVWRHTLKTVEGVPADLTLRWAALLHDVAKGLPGIRGTGRDGFPTDYGHDQYGAQIAKKILGRFQYGKALVDRVGWLIARHMRVTARREDNDRAIWRWLRSEARSGEFRNAGQMAAAFTQLGKLCLADSAATGRAGDLAIPRLLANELAALAAQMPVNTTDLNYQADSLRDILGKPHDMGTFLKNVLARVQDGVLPNTSAAIENSARRWLERKIRKLEPVAWQEE